MIIEDVRGLKYPDEFLTRFFFKRGLNSKQGKVLELGCSNGSNLGLFYQNDWDVTGVDVDEQAIRDANYNFANLKNKLRIDNSYSFVVEDMLEYVEKTKDTFFDCLVLASSIYYLTPSDISKLITKLKLNKIIKDQAEVYLRVRNVDDYRFSQGKKIDSNCFELSISETGEKGCINTFFTVEQVNKIVSEDLNMENIVILKLNFQNFQNDKIISNSESIVWGKYGEKR